MKEIDATRLKLKALEMVEGTDLKWWNVIKLTGCLYHHALDFSANKEDYELALGIVESKSVWEGDVLYNPYGKFTATINDRELNWACCSWNPPKPKTIPVELPLELVEYFAHWTPSIFAGSNSDRQLYSACRDALEKQTDTIKYKSSHEGSATGCLKVPEFDHTGATSK